MVKIAILGASAMGSALARPLLDAGHDVNLWGTQFDEGVLDLYEQGRPHPGTAVALPPQVKRFRAPQLEAATKGAEVIAFAVASGGLLPVTLAALPSLRRARALWLTTKGLVETESGEVLLLTEAMARAATAAGVTLPPVISIAGPVIAKQCALGRPTATVFACSDFAAAAHYAQVARTENYFPFASADAAGVEILAATKNVYAIALGAAEGLEEASGISQSNLRAAAFTQAVAEMSLLCELLGGQRASATGLAGIGDLEVTGISGRNKFYGMRLGRGEHPREALEQMRQAGQTVEGVAAAPLAVKLAAQRFPEALASLPLLQTIAAGVAGTADLRSTLVSAALEAPAWAAVALQDAAGGAEVWPQRQSRQWWKPAWLRR